MSIWPNPHSSWQQERALGLFPKRGIPTMTNIKTSTMKRPWLLAAIGLAIGIAGGAALADGRYGDRTALERLDGVYASTAPEAWYGGFGTRTFTFENGRWGLTFTHALDPAMEHKTFRFRTEGTFDVGKPSTTVPGAFETVFHEDVKHVTLLMTDPKLIAAFGFAGCGLKPGVEVDVSSTGCAGWKPVAVCGEDHDLLAIDAAGLYFGVRPADNDMCTPDKRPTALLQPVVKKPAS